MGCVREKMSKNFHMLQMIATLQRFQGLRACVVLVFLVTSTSGMMRDFYHLSILIMHAQSELYVFARLDK